MMDGSNANAQPTDSGDHLETPSATEMNQNLEAVGALAINPMDEQDTMEVNVIDPLTCSSAEASESEEIVRRPQLRGTTEDNNPINYVLNTDEPMAELECPNPEETYHPPSPMDLSSGNLIRSDPTQMEIVAERLRTHTTRSLPRQDVEMRDPILRSLLQDTRCASPPTSYGSTSSLPSTSYGTFSSLPPRPYASTGPLPSTSHASTGPLPSTSHASTGPLPSTSHASTGPLPSRPFSSTGPPLKLSSPVSLLSKKIVSKLSSQCSDVIENIRANFLRNVNNEATRSFMPTLASPLVDKGLYATVFPEAGSMPYYYYDLNARDMNVAPYVDPSDYIVREYTPTALQRQNPTLSNLLRRPPALILSDPVLAAMLGSPYRRPPKKFFKNLNIRIRDITAGLLKKLRKNLLRKAYEIIRLYCPNLAKEWRKMDEDCLRNMENEDWLEKRRTTLKTVHILLEVLQGQLAAIWDFYDPAEEFLDQDDLMIDPSKLQFPIDPVRMIVYRVTEENNPANPDANDSENDNVSESEEEVAVENPPTESVEEATIAVPSSESEENAQGGSAMEVEEEGAVGGPSTEVNEEGAVGGPSTEVDEESAVGGLSTEVDEEGAVGGPSMEVDEEGAVGGPSTARTVETLPQAQIEAPAPTGCQGPSPQAQAVMDEFCTQLPIRRNPYQRSIFYRKSTMGPGMTLLSQVPQPLVLENEAQQPVVQEPPPLPTTMARQPPPTSSLSRPLQIQIPGLVIPPPSVPHATDEAATAASTSGELSLQMAGPSTSRTFQVPSLAQNAANVAAREVPTSAGGGNNPPTPVPSSSGNSSNPPPQGQRQGNFGHNPMPHLPLAPSAQQPNLAPQRQHSGATDSRLFDHYTSTSTSRTPALRTRRPEEEDRAREPSATDSELGQNEAEQVVEMEISDTESEQNRNRMPIRRAVRHPQLGVIEAHLVEPAEPEPEPIGFIVQARPVEPRPSGSHHQFQADPAEPGPSGSHHQQQIDDQGSDESLQEEAAAKPPSPGSDRYQLDVDYFENLGSAVVVIPITDETMAPASPSPKKEKKSPRRRRGKRH